MSKAHSTSSPPAWLKGRARELFEQLRGVSTSPLRAVTLARYCIMLDRWLAAVVSLAGNSGGLPVMGRDDKVTRIIELPALKELRALAPQLLALERALGLVERPGGREGDEVLERASLFDARDVEALGDETGAAPARAGDA